MIDVIYEDNHIIVVNKPIGVLVQGDKTGDLPLSEQLKTYLKLKYKKPGKVFLGVIHRLDRPTSGVIVFAKTSKALTRLNQSFSKRETNKIYWTLVENRPPKSKGRLVHYLKRHHKQNKSYAYPKEIPESKKAILDYELLLSLDHYHLLKIELETGRHHQIRSQLSYIGSIIKGDLKYGAKRSNSDGGIHLHSRSLSFIHPVKKVEMTFEASLPKEKLWSIVCDKLNA